MGATWTPPRPADRKPAPRAGETSGPGLDRSDIPMPLPGRPLWVIFGTLIAIVGLGWGAFNVVDLLAHEEIQRSETFAAVGITTINVDNDGGRVEIIGADTDEIRLDADISRGLRETGYSWEMVGDTLQVEGTCPMLGSQWCWVKYRIVVPRGVDVIVNSDDDRIAVSEIEGDVTVNANNGRVELGTIAGTVVVDSDNGRISGTGLTSDSVTATADNGRIELAFTDPPALVDARADNGSVDIAVPSVEGDYDVTTQADNGSENVEVTDDPTSSRVIRAETDNGSITIHTSG